MANYRRVARRAANRYGIDPQIFERQIQQESGFQTGRTSGAGAQGIAQIMPATAAGWGVNPNNPRQALNAAAAHMAQYLKSYHGSWSKALTAYNAGPGRVGGHLPAETQNYIRTILGGKGEVRNSGTPGLAPTSRSWNEPTFDAAGFQADKRKAILGQMIAKSNPNSILLKSGLLTTELPNEADYSGSKRVTKHIPGVPGVPASTLSGGNAPGGKGVAHFDGKPVAAWIQPVLAYARSQGWKGTVNSGYRSFADQTRIYNSGVRPAAKPGTSNHEGAEFPRGAVDVSDAAQLSAIIKKSKYRHLLQWAGAKDPVHFSHPHGGSY